MCGMVPPPPVAVTACAALACGFLMGSAGRRGGAITTPRVLFAQRTGLLYLKVFMPDFAEDSLRVGYVQTLDLCPGLPMPAPAHNAGSSCVRPRGGGDDNTHTSQQQLRPLSWALSRDSCWTALTLNAVHDVYTPATCIIPLFKTLLAHPCGPGHSLRGCTARRQRDARCTTPTLQKPP